MTKTANRLSGLGVAIVFCCTGFSGGLQAEVVCEANQACTQIIVLTPGWNAVHVQVNPADNKIAEVFADLVDGDGPQLTSVWTYLAHRAKVDFIQNPDPENLLSAPGWLRYFPESSGRPFLTNLFIVQANRSYLVKLGGSSNVTLTIAGRPVVPRASWEPDSFNLTGFHVDPSNRPTFADFFAASPAHTEQPVYMLANDVWQEVDTDSAMITPDVAYWVYVKGGSDYTGPLQVGLPQLDRLEYGATLKQLTPRIVNPLTVDQSVSLQVIGGESGMHYPDPDPQNLSDWLRLPSSLTMTVSAQGEIRLPLGIRRADFTPNDLLQTVEVTSAAGSRWLIPVTASAPALNSLWVGSVTIEKVSEVQNYKHDCDTDPTGGLADPGTGFFDLCLDDDGFPIPVEGNLLTEVSGAFSFRVIMHRDGDQVRLLKDVIQMRNGDGGYVLLTDDTLIPDFTGVTLRDGEVVGRRISTMAYDFVCDSATCTQPNSHNMTGSLDHSLYAMLVLSATAATNPFRHHYHADHDEGYEVIREMEFEFNTVDEGLSAGYDRKQGTYRETISGLHKQPIVAEGSFTLSHAAQIDTLNPEPNP